MNNKTFDTEDGRWAAVQARDAAADGQCSLGAILVAQSQRGICAILLGDDPDLLVRDLQDQFPKACATNHMAVAIPCHRVVRRDGDLGGYRWGVDRKRELLRREAND